MGLFRQEYWSELPFPLPGDLPNSGIEPMSFMSHALAGRQVFLPLVPKKKKGNKNQEKSPSRENGGEQCWDVQIRSNLLLIYILPQAMSPTLPPLTLNFSRCWPHKVSFFFFFFFYSFLATPYDLQDLSFPPEIEPGPQWWKSRILTTRQPGNSKISFSYQCFGWERRSKMSTHYVKWGREKIGGIEGKKRRRKKRFIF